MCQFRCTSGDLLWKHKTTVHYSSYVPGGVPCRSLLDNGQLCGLVFKTLTALREYTHHVHPQTDLPLFMDPPQVDSHNTLTMMQRGMKSMASLHPMKISLPKQLCPHLNGRLHHVPVFKLSKCEPYAQHRCRFTESLDGYTLIDEPCALYDKVNKLITLYEPVTAKYVDISKQFASLFLEPDSQFGEGFGKAVRRFGDFCGEYQRQYMYGFRLAYQGPNDTNLYKWNRENMHHYNSVLRFFQHMTNEFRAVLPDIARQQENGLKRNNVKTMHGTMFCNAAVGINNPVRNHLDNLDKGYSYLVTLFHGTVDGAYFVYPEYKIAFEMRNCSSVWWVPSEVCHGTTQMWPQQHCARIGIATQVNSRLYNHCKKELQTLTTTQLP